MTNPELEVRSVGEYLSRTALRELQAVRLRSLLDRLATHPMYRERLEDCSRTLEDLGNLPFTHKVDLYGHESAWPGIVRYHSSSGTTGARLPIPYTAGDLRIWSTLTGRLCVAAGLTSGDVVHVGFTYGMFTGGFGLHAGAESLGACVIPASAAVPREQLRLMASLRATALVCTPTFALYLADQVHQGDLALRVGLFGAEPWTKELRGTIEKGLGITAYNNYGLSEVFGPGVAYECSARNGMHLSEDHVLAEIVDPETGEAMPDGEVGELVLTTLTKAAMPVLRYRTGDITRFMPGDCPCGRTSRRIGWILGRTDDMIFADGVKVFPSSIESVVFDVLPSATEYAIECEKRSDRTRVKVKIECDESHRTDAMIKAVRTALFEVTGVRAMVELVPAGTLPRAAGKAKRVSHREEAEAGKVRE